MIPAARARCARRRCVSAKRRIEGMRVRLRRAGRVRPWTMEGRWLDALGQGCCKAPRGAWPCARAGRSGRLGLISAGGVPQACGVQGRPRRVNRGTARGGSQRSSIRRLCRDRGRQGPRAWAGRASVSMRIAVGPLSQARIRAATAAHSIASQRLAAHDRRYHSFIGG
ncbi:MAG: hypothetical protein J3K34DRAFT_443598 [Monoraphidium minutum]|nr:MAG: hypothetical protein J3K34DRAFT_443598 [Monoraphidium minutum]